MQIANKRRNSSALITVFCRPHCTIPPRLLPVFFFLFLWIGLLQNPKEPTMNTSNSNSRECPEVQSVVNKTIGKRLSTWQAQLPHMDIIGSYSGTYLRFFFSNKRISFSKEINKKKNNNTRKHMIESTYPTRSKIKLLLSESFGGYAYN